MSIINGCWVEFTCIEVQVMEYGYKRGVQKWNIDERYFIVIS